MPAYQEGYIQCLRNPLTYLVNSVSGEDANFLGNNVKAWEFQSDPWKTIVKNVNQYIVGDLQSAKALNSFAIFNCNAPQVNIQFHSTTDFTAPAVQTGNITINKNVFSERYNILINPQDYGAVNHRYWRVLIPANQTTRDGDSVYSIGGIAVGDSLTDYMFDVNSGFSLSATKAKEILTMIGGRDEVWEYSSMRLIMAVMTFNLARDVSEFTQFAELLVTIDNSTPVVLGFNELLHETTGDAWVLPMRRLDDPDYSIQHWGLSVGQRITFKETK